jgi:hypothetical protein
VLNDLFSLVHHTDASRIDLIIPGEAHFYLRAATPQDRQKWVVALGSAKACVTNDIITSHSAPASKLLLLCKCSANKNLLYVQLVLFETTF